MNQWSHFSEAPMGNEMPNTAPDEPHPLPSQEIRAFEVETGEDTYDPRHFNPRSWPDQEGKP
jgi:hypothetical protein